MKKNMKSMAIMGLAIALLSEQSIKVVEENPVQKPIAKPKKQIPFKEQQGISNMIKDYHLIKSGNSKKGLVKQFRITRKIESLLKSGLLKESDLTPNKH